MGRFDNYKFHCSSLGEIMVDSRTKEPLGETCKKHLLKCWIAEKYGRYKEDENKYIQKGNMAEEDGITLYSLCTGQMYVKNTETFSNDYIIGTPDLIKGDTVIDIKNAWSLFTFWENIVKPLNKDYVYQLNGYKAILGLPKANLVYTLCNTPDVLIEQEKSRLRYKMGLIDPEANEVYLQACKMIDKNSTFDDIDMKERYIEFEVPPVDIGKVYERIQLCREFLNKLG